MMAAMDSFKVLQERVRGTNINAETLLATDYLNHFNEIIMLLEMVADIPECLDDALDWQPKDYQAHFRDSGISDKELAIEAYEHVPARFLEPFERTVAAMNDRVRSGLDEIRAIVARDEPEALRRATGRTCRGLHRLVEVASAIIHGQEKTLDQEKIDSILDD